MARPQDRLASLDVPTYQVVDHVRVIGSVLTGWLVSVAWHDLEGILYQVRTATGTVSHVREGELEAGGQRLVTH